MGRQTLHVLPQHELGVKKAGNKLYIHQYFFYISDITSHLHPHCHIQLRCRTALDTESGKGDNINVKSNVVRGGFLTEYGTICLLAG